MVKRFMDYTHEFKVTSHLKMKLSNKLALILQSHSEYSP